MLIEKTLYYGETIINGLEFYGSSLPTNQYPYEHVTK